MRHHLDLWERIAGWAAEWGGDACDKISHFSVILLQASVIDFQQIICTAIFWNVKLCSVEESYHRFGGIYASVDYHEDGGGMSLRKTDNVMPDYTASYREDRSAK